MAFRSLVLIVSLLLLPALLRRARETYKIVNADEFTEVFELAEPGKDFQIYSEGHFRRRK